MMGRDYMKRRKGTAMKDDKRSVGKEHERELGRWCNGSIADF